MHTITNVKQFIIDEFLPDTRGADLDDDLDLIEAGVIDSLGVLKLVAAIEAQYELSIEPEQMQPENYRSVRAIEGLIQRQQAGARDAGVAA